ncbi:neuronal growth regulator 1 isoform X2 [Protopterus annectens]|uniref:neuronal growth regulator 1 isoform X2 n=1 Tax=Protopterus annectens TaxID=7888 RepID=UPI001CF9F0D8|nr:neuronal growth regulator 1 isoform X2 [Protopterus annectens]
MDMRLVVQDAFCFNQWFAAVILSLFSVLPCCLPAGQSLEFQWPAVEDNNIVVRQGDTAILRCFLADGTSKGAWLNRSSIIFAGNDKWSVDPRISIGGSSKLEYSLQIRKVDVTDDGPYTCSVQTQNNPRAVQMHLTVQVPPKIYDISTNMGVNEGNNVTLMCLASGKPDPSITWRHISPSGKSFENGEYLEIFGITRDQAGEYECSAGNDVSFADVKKVRITVNFPPKILELTHSGVITGHAAAIRCETAAVPSATYDWYKGDKKLFNGQQGITIKDYKSRSVLTISNVTEGNFGNYTCVATNIMGTDNSSILINPPSTAQYGITGNADILSSSWYLALVISSSISIF